MAPRKKDVEEASDVKHKINSKDMVMKRKCTDGLCCLIFTICIIAMIFVTFIGIKSGDPTRILTPFDSDGNECGMPNQSGKKNGTVERDFTDYKFKYFTGLLKAASGDSS